MHNKSFTVDNQVTIVGGRNLADEYFQTSLKTEFLDEDISAIGPVVDARPESVQRRAHIGPGAYLLSGEGTVRLYHWHMPLSDPPRDCPLMKAADLRGILVVTGQPFQTSAYRLHRLGAGVEVAWRSVHREGQRFLLDPGPLAPGGYLLTMPTHDLFGSKTYHYFRLQ